MSHLHWMRKTAVSAVVAGALALGAHSNARAEANPELMLKALGTTEGIGPIVTATFERASAALSEEDRALALKCWSEQVCETGRGDLTVALADGFGENVWRRVTHMEFVMQALSYPAVSKIIYTSARGDASKAISDMRSLIAQGVDIIVTFPDAGPALLPTAQEATESGITVVPYIAGLGGTPRVKTISPSSPRTCASWAASSSSSWPVPTARRASRSSSSAVRPVIS